MQPQVEVPIRCIHCDYDLRGLAGDPVRCPECGEYSLWSDSATRMWYRGAEAGWRGVIAGFFMALMSVFSLLFFTRVPRGLIIASMILIFALWVREMYLISRRLKWSWRILANICELQVAVPVAAFVVLSGPFGCILLSLTLLRWAGAPSVVGWIQVPTAFIAAFSGIVASVLVCYFLIAVTCGWVAKSSQRLSNHSREYLLLGRYLK